MTWNFIQTSLLNLTELGLENFKRELLHSYSERFLQEISNVFTIDSFCGRTLSGMTYHTIKKINKALRFERGCKKTFLAITIILFLSFHIPYVLKCI